MIKYPCPTCGGRIEVQDEFANKLIDCPVCNAVTEVPLCTRVDPDMPAPPLIPGPATTRSVPVVVRELSRKDYVPDLVRARTEIRIASAYGKFRMWIQLVGCLAVLGLVWGSLLLQSGAMLSAAVAIVFLGAVALLLCDIADTLLLVSERAREK